MPPRPIYFALHYEGNSDRHFLPVIIRRTVIRMTADRERYSLDVQDLTVINDWIDDTGPYKARILRAAQEACGFSALIIHRDADSSTRDNAKRRYFDPIQKAVQNCSEPVCEKLVPIIPVRCIEAWMLADPIALQAATSTDVPVAHLGLPDHPSQVEAVQEPKHILTNAVTVACGRRRRNSIDIATLYDRLADRIDLARLDKVPSYHDFVSDMGQMLVDLGLIHGTGRT